MAPNKEPKLQSDPKRSDWLDNLWMYIRQVELRLDQVEARLNKIELEIQRSSNKPIRFKYENLRRGIDEED